MVFWKARYCNGFPNIDCNVKRLPHSTVSIPSRAFPSIPAGFVTKFTTVAARIKLRESLPVCGVSRRWEGSCALRTRLSSYRVFEGC